MSPTLKRLNGADSDVYMPATDDAPCRRTSRDAGEEYAAPIIGNWGAVDYPDLMAFVDAALERFPFIDSERLGMTDGSYGGYMTNWIVTHTDRFKAAVAQRSTFNRYSFHEVSDIGHSPGAATNDGVPRRTRRSCSGSPPSGMWGTRGRRRCLFTARRSTVPDVAG